MTGPSSTMLEQAAAWAVGFQLTDAPVDVIELSKMQVANIIAAIVAGSASQAGLNVREAIGATAAPGPCTVIPHGDQFALNDALFLHAVYANALELDDFHYRGHLGPATVVVPLTLGEWLGANGADVLRAQIIGNEIGGRLGWSISAEVRHGHQRSYLVRLAAAAAAAALLTLDRRQFATALAIAMTQPDVPLHPGMYSPDTKVLSAAPSVVEGVRAAFLARAGLSAAMDIVEHSAGFYRQFTMHKAVESPYVQFGTIWCTHALSFKRYSACAYASGTVDAALIVRSDPRFRLDAVRSIEVAAQLPALILERLAQPHEDGVLTPVNVQFSILRSVAAALTAGELRGRQFQPAAFAAMVPGIQRLTSVSRLVHEWSLTIHQLRGIEDAMPEGGGNSADMLQYYRTSSAFRRMFGSVRAIGLADIGRLLSLPAADRQFFIDRWRRSAANRWSGKRRARTDQVGDLRKLSMRMGGRVTVTLTDGSVLSAERIVPSGMAGDPNRLAMVREKLIEETRDVLGLDRAHALLRAIDLMETATVVELMAKAGVSPAAVAADDSRVHGLRSAPTSMLRETSAPPSA